MLASIIIRTKNEAKRIGDVLELLANQSKKDFEVIIVDSGSTDKTLDIIKQFNNKLDIKIYTIPTKDFTYPYACNFGAEKSTGKYLIYLSGHSIPVSKTWLENGINDFDDKKVAGVYGAVRSSIDATFTEKVFYFPAKLLNHKRKISKKRLGLLGNTNSIIPKKLWQEYHFNEKFVEGGEDTEWANHFLKKGYIIIRDPKFSVYHSHGYQLYRFLKQYQLWQKTFNNIK